MKSKVYVNVDIDPTRERICKACKEVKLLTDFKIREGFRTPASIKKYPGNRYFHFCLECWYRPRECNAPLAENCQESAVRWVYIKSGIWKGGGVLGFCEKDYLTFISRIRSRCEFEEISEDTGRELRAVQRIVNG